MNWIEGSKKNIISFINERLKEGEWNEPANIIPMYVKHLEESEYIKLINNIKKFVIKNEETFGYIITPKTFNTIDKAELWLKKTNFKIWSIFFYEYENQYYIFYVDENDHV